MNQVYEWEGGRVRQLTHGPFEHRNATWAPDGERIALRSTRDAEHGIYLMDPLRLSPQRVGTVSPEHGVPFFSPDGSTPLLTPSGPEGTRVSTLDLRTEVITPVPGACVGMQGGQP